MQQSLFALVEILTNYINLDDYTIEAESRTSIEGKYDISPEIGIMSIFLQVFNYLTSLFIKTLP